MMDSQNPKKTWPRINFMTSDKDYPLSLSTEGEGAMWRCGDFIITWQRNPKTLQERAAELLERHFTPTKRFPFVLMGFLRSEGPQHAPSIILAIEIPLDRAPEDGSNALVRLSVAGPDGGFGGLPDLASQKKEEVQQILLNSFGDFVGIKDGEIIRHIGQLSDFREEKHWKDEE